jgi:mono/diheme cytochrome c family protein
MIKNKIEITCIVFLLFIVAGCSPGGSKSPGQQSQPPVVTEQPLSPGQILYAEKCAVCHGEDGTAGIGNAANLQTSKLEHAAIKELVRNGKNGMPPFGGQLNDDGLEKLATYVISLRR